MADEFTKIALILMASGSSKRMGQDKLFLEIQKGDEVETLLEHSLNLILKVRAEGIKRQVLWEPYGVCQKDQVRKRCEAFGISTIYNERAALGQSESVKLGAVKALDLRVLGACYMTADQPGLEPWVLHRLAEAFAEAFRREGKVPDAVIPTVGGEWMSPVIIGSQCLDALMALEGDRGAKSFLKGEGRQVIELPFEDANCFMDIDTPEDYLRFR